MRFYFSEREIDFTQEYFPYEQFLLQEFFDLDECNWEKVRGAWIKRYGSLSYDIMSRKYEDWRGGNYHLTMEMQQRIIGMMPVLLSDDALKRVGLYEYARAIKGIVKSHLSSRVDRYKKKRAKLSLQEWQALVIEEFQAIGQLPPWPHKYHPLSADDAKATASIARFILQLKLARYEDQVLRDVLAIQSVYGALLRSGAEIKYAMRRFAVGLDLVDLPHLEVKGSGQEQICLPSDGYSTYQAYADKYFAYEFAQVQTDVIQDEANATTFMTDLSLFLQHIDASRTGDLETVLSQNLKGEGGALKLRVSIVPPRAAMSTLKRASLKLASVVLGTGLYSVLMVRLGMVGLLVFSALFILPVVLPTVVSLTREILRARKGVLSP